MFLIGFLDDLKININPLKRLILMILLLFILIFFLPIKISNVDIPFLKSLLNNSFFQPFLCCYVFYLLLMAQT